MTMLVWFMQHQKKLNIYNESQLFKKRKLQNTECNIKNCLLCENRNQCIKCKDEYELVDNRCYSKNCEIFGFCKYCDDYDCLKCITGYKLNYGICDIKVRSKKIIILKISISIIILFLLIYLYIYLKKRAKEKIETVEDLLLSYPNRFEDYTIKPIDLVNPDELVTIAGIVQSKAIVINTKTRLSIMNFYVEVDGKKLKVTIFNRHFLKSKIQYGVYVRLTGKLKPDYKSFVASEIHFDEFENSINPIFNIKKIPDSKILEFKEKVFNKYSNLIVSDICKDYTDEELAEKLSLEKSGIYLRKKSCYIKVAKYFHIEVFN